MIETYIILTPEEVEQQEKFLINNIAEMIIKQENIINSKEKFRDERDKRTLGLEELEKIKNKRSQTEKRERKKFEDIIKGLKIDVSKKKKGSKEILNIVQDRFFEYKKEVMKENRENSLLFRSIENPHFYQWTNLRKKYQECKGV